MKKLKSVLITVLAAFSLTACGTGGTGSNNSANANTPSKSENAAVSANSSTAGKTESDAASTDSQYESASSTPDASDGSKILVAYFSATNTTEGVAKTIAKCVNGDLYEITPEQPYTSDDLDYHNDKSRSTLEMNDPDSRPAISGSVSDFEKYDIVFVGYPIWWGEAPRICCTFVESYDFSGKTVVPFCTSGSSGVGSSATNIEKLTSGATWLSGTRFNVGASSNEISDWIKGLNIGN